MALRALQARSGDRGQGLTTARGTGLALALLSAAPAAAAQAAFDTVQVRAIAVAPGVHLLSGRGGNIGVSSGPDGVFLVDDQYAPLTEKILAALRTLSPEAPRFVLNTHWHGDHTGGNENLGKAGALIVAHENVRQRMSVEQFNALLDRRTPASPPGALPVVTFTAAVTFYLNGDTVHVFHVPAAHTDGDAIVHFRHAGVIHAGDTFFNGSYPVLDVSAGGTVDGMIRAADTILALAGPATPIIPGHGPLGGRADVERFRAMLVATRDAVRAAMQGGRTVDQVLAAKPTAPWDEAWGRGFVNGERWVRSLFADLSR